MRSGVDADAKPVDQFSTEPSGDERERAAYRVALRGKLVLYRCGDFISDYEGIRGHEQFGVCLGLMYFPTIDGDTGELVELRMVPIRMQRMRATHASRNDAQWLRDTLNRASRPFGTCVELMAGDTPNTTDLLLLRSDFCARSAT